MKVLTNISKSELNYLTNQPTAKALIKKIKSEGIYISENNEPSTYKHKTEDLVEISNEGLDALNKDKKELDNINQEEEIKEKINKLKQELSEIKAQKSNSKEKKEIQEKRINAIMQ